MFTPCSASRPEMVATFHVSFPPGTRIVVVVGDSAAANVTVTPDA